MTPRSTGGGGEGKAGKLAPYRTKRDPKKTPEPMGGRSPDRSPGQRFVIQEHHARSLHWDLRLERDGVLASWALPKGLPETPEQNHLAVHTEDHPLEYATFEGAIPRGEYGGGQMTIWDSGSLRRGEVVGLRGQVRAPWEEGGKGSFVLFQTKDRDWMIHRHGPSSRADPCPAPSSPCSRWRESSRPDSGLGLRDQVGRRPGDPLRRRRSRASAEPQRPRRDVLVPGARRNREVPGNDDLHHRRRDRGAGRGRPAELFHAAATHARVEPREAKRRALSDPVTFVAFDLCISTDIR